MTIETLAFLDCETTGLNPETDRLVEVGCVTFSIKARCMIDAWSGLIIDTENSASEINGIHPKALRYGSSRAQVLMRLALMVQSTDVYACHNLEFDSSFLPDLGRPSFCTMGDVEYPKQSGKSLTAIALAHGVGVVTAHRAIHDCLTLCRLYERLAETKDIRAMVMRALRPKGTFDVKDRKFSRERNKLVKANGFTWREDPIKRWRRTMARDDIKDLPFEVIEVTQ
jgi:DNA polymerase III subunit epsilon